MSAAKRPLSAELARLTEAVPAAKARERACELEHRRVVGELAKLTDAIADFYAQVDEPAAAKASAARAKLEAGAVRECEERLEGARRAVQRAEVERATFTAESISGLLGERSAEASAAAGAVEDAVLRLAQAQKEWTAVESEVGALCRLAGRDTRNMPRMPVQVAELVRDARRAAGVRVPAPLPGDGTAAAAVAASREASPEVGQVPEVFG